MYVMNHILLYDFDDVLMILNVNVVWRVIRDWIALFRQVNFDRVATT